MARRKHREGAGLHKVLGVPALFSTAYGNVGSSIYYALGVVAASALGVTPLVFLLTGLLFCTTAWSYAEATAMVPEAGGSSSFARRAFNELVSFGAGWALLLDYIVTIAISAFFVPNYLAVFWPILKTYPYNAMGGIVTIVVLVIINVIGIKEAARLNIMLALLDLGTQVLLMILGVVLLLEPKLLIDQVIWGTAPTWTQLVYGISIGTVAYTGIETVSNMAEEASNPYRDVPKAINYVLIAVLAVYLGISMTALSAMPVEANVLPLNADRTESVPMAVVAKDSDQPNGPFVFAPEVEVPEGNPVALDEDGNEMTRDGEPVYEVYIEADKQTDGTWETKALAVTGDVETQGDSAVSTFYGTQLGSVYQEDPVVGIVLHLPKSLDWLEAILLPWVGILAATILVIATNAGIIGVSRLAYSLGQHRQVPPILGRVHPRRMTPYIAIIAFGAVACVLLLLPNPDGTTRLLADLYAFGAMISFTVAHISVVWLRFKEPDVDRPFRTPLNIPFRGGSLPVLAVLGGLGTFVVWIVVVWTHEFGRWVGVTWMVVGFLIYIVYRKRKGYSLTKTIAKVVLPESVTEDVDYNQILVPIVGSRITDEMVVLACQLATEKQSSLDVMYVIEVPMHLPLDARLVAEREEAEKVLRQAALVADSFKVPMNAVIVTARQAGRAIVDQALERRSEVIIVGAIRKRRFTERALGGTIDYVMSHAPCEVLINLVPAEGVYAADAKRRSPTVSMETLEAERRAAEQGRQPPPPA